MSEDKVNGKYIIKLKHLELNKISEISFDMKSKDIQMMKIFSNVITLKFSKTQQISNVVKKLIHYKDPDIFGKPERFDGLSCGKFRSQLNLVDKTKDTILCMASVGRLFCLVGQV